MQVLYVNNECFIMEYIKYLKLIRLQGEKKRT